MKSIVRIFSCMIAVCILFSVFSVIGFAQESGVIFEAGAEDFVFVNDDDLFDNFKNLMPGDSVTQKIVIESKKTRAGYVKIYLRAIPHGDDNPLSDEVAKAETIESMNEFLSQLTMSVTCDGNLIYKASPNELEGLSENVLIGTFGYGDKKTLEITLDVPITLGDVFQNSMGEIDWVFTAEEITKEEYKDTLVHITGSKFLDGNEPGADDVFTFALYNQRGEIIQTVTNELSKISFAPMWLEPGVHTFTVRELDSGNENIIYDTNGFKIYVSINNDGEWNSSYYSGGNAFGWFVFNNFTKDDSVAPDPEEPGIDGEDEVYISSGSEETTTLESGSNGWLSSAMLVVAVILAVIAAVIIIKNKKDNK